MEATKRLRLTRKESQVNQETPMDESRKTLQPGTKLGNFEVSELLGVGGMGEVYLARDSKLGREVAIKVLPAELANDPGRRQRLMTEARAASALNHPNVCIIHEVGETDDHRSFIAMEYIEGQMLDERLRRGQLEITEILHIGTQVADALDAAHAKGIVHRDIKPSNISINDRGRVKVLDFGLAKRMIHPLCQNK